MPPKKLALSTQTQLSIAGMVILVILAAAAWAVARPLTWYSALPLLFIGYAAYSIAFELTFNRGNVPTLATTFVGRRKIAKILKQDAELRGKMPYNVIDLGSGRGELTRVIAKKIPSAQVIGIEMARIPCMLSAFVQRWLGPDNLSYKCCDFWSFDCAGIDAVVFYLTPSLAQRVGEKLYRELKPGSVVISHTFPLLGAWTPKEVMHFRSPFKETIYIYSKTCS
jgi:SAM-dependent methyltransferase